MRIEVKVPQLPESVTEATLVNWHKRPGEPVKRDENLIDVETDKVVLELPAPNDGVLIEITREDGATVTSNDVIGVIDTDAKGAQSAAAKAPAQTPVQPAPTPHALHTAPEPAKAAEAATAMPAAASPKRTLRPSRPRWHPLPLPQNLQHRPRNRPHRAPNLPRLPFRYRPRSVRVPSSVCPCRACDSALPNVSCNRNRPPRF